MSDSRNALIETRILTPKDCVSYWHLRLQALEEVPRAFGASAEKFRLTQPEDMGERLTAQPGGSFMIGGFADHNLIGTLGFGRPEPGPLAEIYGVYVAPEGRGLGMASWMFETMLCRARSYDGLKTIHLECFSSSTRAIALYRKYGFETIHLQERAVKIEDAYVDVHQMTLHLR